MSTKRFCSNPRSDTVSSTSTMRRAAPPSPYGLTVVVSVARNAGDVSCAIALAIACRSQGVSITLLARTKLPVYFGAAGRLGMAHTAEWADGWCPIEVAFRDLSVGISRMQGKLQEAGRNLSSMPITLFAWGEPDSDKLSRFRDLGVDQVLFGTGTMASCQSACRGPDDSR